MKLACSYAGTLLADVRDDLYYDTFFDDFLVLIGKALIVCLFRVAKQRTELSYGQARILFVQAFYCLAPAFFLIDIFSTFSAMFIIVSYACA